MRLACVSLDDTYYEILNDPGMAKFITESSESEGHSIRRSGSIHNGSESNASPSTVDYSDDSSDSYKPGDSPKRKRSEHGRSQHRTDTTIRLNTSKKPSMTVKQRMASTVVPDSQDEDKSSEEEGDALISHRNKIQQKDERGVKSSSDEEALSKTVPATFRSENKTEVDEKLGGLPAHPANGRLSHKDMDSGFSSTSDDKDDDGSSPIPQLKLPRNFRSRLTFGEKVFVIPVAMTLLQKRLTHFVINHGANMMDEYSGLHSQDQSHLDQLDKRISSMLLVARNIAVHPFLVLSTSAPTARDANFQAAAAYLVASSKKFKLLFKILQSLYNTDMEVAILATGPQLQVRL